MSTESYRWHYDYTRILWDAGFCFNNHKSLKTFDRNGIALLDIERIINDRDIRTVDYHIQSILEYSLDSEEARILDPNFVKLFRLSQLAVEYLNYCKKYLDATTDTLKKELQKTNEENTDLKNDLVSYELEISKLKKKVKDLKSTLHIHQKYQPALSYPSTSATYRCNECRKGFISAEYLKKHFLKRHPNSSEIDQLEAKLDNIEIDTESNSSVHPQYKAETDKLQMEIKELKEKLNNTERLFQNKTETPVEENKKENEESKPQSEEYYKYIEELHHQFELLKTQIESEMQLLKSQKVEKDKYEELMEKFFHKLDERKEQEESKIDDNQPSTSKVDSPVQTDDVVIETEIQKVEQNKNEEIITVDEETETSPKKSNLSKTINTAISVPSIEQQSVNVEKIKKEVERELEIKSKQNIERLGKQISDNITNTFDVLQERLETFWNKLQEIETDHKRQQIPKSPAKPETATPKKDNIIQVGAPKKVQNIQEQVQPFQISSDDSETESSKEDNIQIIKPQSVLKTVQQNDKMARNILAELKTKVEERNSTSQPPSRQPSPEKPQKITPKSVEKQKITVVRKTKPFVVEKPPVKDSPIKEEKPKPAERPTVQHIYYSKTAKESSSEGESESETESESESEESESEVPVIVKPSTKTITSSSKSLRPNTNSTGISTLQNRSITSLENALKTNPDIFVQLKENMKEIVDSRLKDLGIDPEWCKIPNKTYKQNNDIITHHRNMAVKNVKSFMEIRNNILEQLDNQVKSFKRSDSHDLTTPELEQKPSRFKNLIQNMRNKAKSIIKHERTPTPTTPIYKLTIHKNYSSPSIKQSPEKQKIKTVKKTEQKTMYESDSDGSEIIEHRRNSPVKNKPQPTKKQLRKSRSESSMEVVELSDRDIPQASSNNNLARSLDSIIEMKKELASQLNKPEDQIQSVSSLDTVDKEEVVIVSPRVQNGSGDFQRNKLNISSSDLDSDEIKDDDRIQKSVLKNMATITATKKKVLFDLHSDKTEITEEQKLAESKTIKKTVVKPNNSLFKTNEWGDSSTSIDSSILEIKKGAKHPTKGQGDTISTKAVINVSTKQNKAQGDISDWDISDIN